MKGAINNDNAGYAPDFTRGIYEDNCRSRAGRKTVRIRVRKMPRGSGNSRRNNQ